MVKKLKMRGLLTHTVRKPRTFNVSHLCEIFFDHQKSLNCIEIDFFKVIRATPLVTQRDVV